MCATTILEMPNLWSLLTGHCSEAFLSYKDSVVFGDQKSSAWDPKVVEKHCLRSKLHLPQTIHLGVCVVQNFCWKDAKESKVARPKKIKKAKFGHKQLQKHQILKWNKVKFSMKNCYKILNKFWNFMKCCIFSRKFVKRPLFSSQSKEAKNVQLATLKEMSFPSVLKGIPKNLLKYFLTMRQYATICDIPRKDTWQ